MMEIKKEDKRLNAFVTDINNVCERASPKQLLHFHL